MNKTHWLAAGLLAASLPVQAQSCTTTGNGSLVASCTTSATSLSFGNYAFTTSAPTDAAGSVNVTCVSGLVSLLLSYDILLGAGSSGSYAARTMANGSNQLQYNLYAASPPASVWGDGSGATTVVQYGPLLLAVLSQISCNYPVYGRVPAGQNVPAGVYQDTITVTVNY